MKKLTPLIAWAAFGLAFVLLLLTLLGDPLPQLQILVDLKWPLFLGIVLALFYKQLHRLIDILLDKLTEMSRFEKYPQGHVIVEFLNKKKQQYTTDRVCNGPPIIIFSSSLDYSPRELEILDFLGFTTFLLVNEHRKAFNDDRKTTDNIRKIIEILQKQKPDSTFLSLVNTAPILELPPLKWGNVFKN